MKKKLRLPVIILILFIFFLLFAPHGNYIKTDVVNTFAAPSRQHWMGTDNLGIGTVLGMTAGYYGGILGSVIQFISDFSLVIPSFIVTLTISALFGSSHFSNLE